VEWSREFSQELLQHWTHQRSVLFCPVLLTQTKRAFGAVACRAHSGFAGLESLSANAAALFIHTGLGDVTLAEILSIPTTWDWTASGGASSSSSDVSYDAWLSNSPGTTWADGTSTVELMVWLAGYGAGTPAGSKVGTVTVAGLEWTYWKGTVQSWASESFAACHRSSAAHSSCLPR
jgi:hypothetical protein